MEKNTSTYLDIYKNDGKLVIQLGKNIFLNKKSEEFFEYLGYLKNNKINILLLDEKGKQIFNSNENNSFLEKEKKEIGNFVNNILLLDNDSKILDINNKKVEFITIEKLKEILNLEYNKIKIKKGTKLYNKLEEIYKLLKNGFSKVTLVGIDGVEDEIEGFGKGTMFVNLEKSKFKKIKNKELFKQIYEEKKNAREWKERTEEELENIASNYEVLELEGTILGGYYLGDFEKEVEGKKMKGQLLENLFSSKIGGGVGYILGEKIKEQPLVFAYSKKEDFFINIGFKKIEGEKSETGADLWIYQKS